jgi:predicted transcriptional regulator
MYVLLSVKPRFAKDIFSGIKKYEFRKTIFTRQDIKKVVVYASSPIKSVIGEFEIDKIIHDDIDALWTQTKSGAGTSEELFLEYFSNKSKGYAIKIKSQKKYDSPLSLNSLRVSVPPQSFRYLDTGILELSSMI